MISLPTGFREFLEDLDIVSLSQAPNTLPGLHKYWYTIEDLCIAGDWKLAWDTFMRSLEIGGIRLNSLSNSLIWAYNKFDGSVSAKLVYDCIVHSSSPSVGSRLLTHIWTGSLPRKISCFIWLALMNKLLTWDNLQKRGWTGPGICALCSKAVDSVQHLFFHCTVWKNVIDIIKEQYHITPSFQSDDLCSYLENGTVCFSKNSAYYYLPFLAMWVVWKAINISIFEGNIMTVTSIFHQITYFS